MRPNSRLRHILRMFSGWTHQPDLTREEDVMLWHGRGPSAFARPRRWNVVVWVVVGVLLILAPVVGSLMARDGNGEPITGARRTGDAHANTTADTVVVRVGQQEIIPGDLSEGRAIVAYDTALMREEIARGAIGASFLIAYLGMMEQAGQDNVALGAAIAKAAMYQKAMERGFSATREEVEKEVANQCEIAGKMRQEGHPESARNDAYIQAVGEEYYWSQVMPAWAARNIAIRKLNAAVLSGVDPSKRNQAWAEFERATVLGVKIEILDPAAIAPATLTGAMEYLSKVFELRLANAT